MKNQIIEVIRQRLQTLSLREIILFLGRLALRIAIKIFWHLPAVLLIRLPIKLLRFMIDPKNRMKAFIILTVFALTAMTRTLVRKAAERRDRLSKRNIFQQF
jgi:hypothetical protein